MIDLEPKQLRDRAKRIMEVAEQCDDHTIYLYEKNKANKLFKLADELEKQNES
jgi:hypothetical protein